MNSIKAKVQVYTVLQADGQETPTMHPVMGGNPEDNAYSKYTPSGKVELAITNPACFGFFKPGKKYEVTFTEAAE